jgi:hypothetical protein
MNELQQSIYQEIGSGMRLRVPHDGSPATMEPDPRFKQAMVPFPGESRVVSVKELSQALASGLLHKLAEENIEQRIGWREAGMDGDVADWYVMTQ